MSLGLKRNQTGYRVVKSITPLQDAIKKASKGYNKKPKLTVQEIESKKADLEILMRQAADALDFEKAIQLREEWLNLG